MEMFYDMPGRPRNEASDLRDISSTVSGGHQRPLDTAVEEGTGQNISARSKAL
jgi:hypothetical protein